MKLKFNQDAWYNGTLIAKSGEIKEISEENDFALRWIKRGAEEVSAEEVKPEVKLEVKEDVVIDKPEVKEENKKVKPTKGK